LNSGSCLLRMPFMLCVWYGLKSAPTHKPRVKSAAGGCRKVSHLCAELGIYNTKGSKVMDCRIAIFAASSRGARPPSGAPPRALAGRLKKPACGYSNLSMSVAGRNRRHPRRARSPRPDATAPLSKSPKAIGFWYKT
jgi:hypothetical protein